VEQLPREAVGGPSLEASRPGWMSGLSWWGALPTSGGWNWEGSEVPSNLIHSMSYVKTGGTGKGTSRDKLFLFTTWQSETQSDHCN